MKQRMRHESMWISYALILFGALNQSFGAFEGIVDDRYFGAIMLLIGLIDGWLSYKSQR